MWRAGPGAGLRDRHPLGEFLEPIQDDVDRTLANPKSKTFHGPVFSDFDIRGLHVAVNHTGFVGCLQRLSDLLRYREGFINWDRSFGNPVSEGRPFHQLQHQRTGALAFF